MERKNDPATYYDLARKFWAKPGTFNCEQGNAWYRYAVALQSVLNARGPKPQQFGRYYERRLP